MVSTIFFLLLLISTVAMAQNGGGGSVPARELWCVAKNNAVDSELQSALDWACGPGGADCASIQRGGPCYDASDLQKTASYAFNDYFHKNGQSDDSCNFQNTAALTSLNPSHNSCKFPSSLSTASGNFTGSGIVGPSDSANITSNSLKSWHWDWRSTMVVLFFPILLMF